MNPAHQEGTKETTNGKRIPLRCPFPHRREMRRGGQLAYPDLCLGLRTGNRLGQNVLKCLPASLGGEGWPGVDRYGNRRRVGRRPLHRTAPKSAEKTGRHQLSDAGSRHGKGFPSYFASRRWMGMSRFSIIAVILDCRRIIADRIRLIQSLR